MLNPEQLERLTQWFEEAVDLPPPEREAFVEKIRRESGDGLASELARILGADAATGTLDQVPTAEPPAFHSTSAFREGEVLLGRFRIVRVLGRGGMGEVYEAEDQELGPVALKTIRSDKLGNAALLRRFKQEVQLARQVTSPYVCRIHELFTLPEGEHRRVAAFLTMELLEGTTLAKRIAQGPLAWSEAEPLALELCQGLEALHSVGLVHRDFKPANAMLAKRGNAITAVVMDLGLALRPDEPLDENSKLTMTGGIVGTPVYMAPEQFEGGKLSPATDIYALGLVLYEMTTGKRPYGATTPLAAAVRRARKPPSITSLQPGLPPHLGRVIEKCLEFESADRFPSAAAVAVALREGVLERPARKPKRWATMLVAVLVAIALLVGGWMLRNRVRHRAGSGSAEANTWYDRGTAALREGTYLKATNALERAVNLDQNFVLAHVRLADAWNELDYSGKAKDEMLKASSLESSGGLSDIEKRYVEAVRHTIVRDFPAALDDYKSILEALPRENKADGYVDLGRAYEKAGNMDQAIGAYSSASKLAPEYPASFVRLAVLEDRRKHTAAADAAYAKAESLYRAASNLEGLAEIDLQRGNNANTQLRLDEARTDLQRALQTAMAIPSAQLEVRCLTRLTVTEYLAYHTAKSLQLANQAVELAQKNGLDYWTTDALIRFGNAYISSGDYDKAAQKFEQALNLADRGEWPRLVALARFSLAQVRLAQNNSTAALPLAKSALEYYRANGFRSESVDALTLVLRAERQNADNQAALKSAQELLALAAELNEPAVRMRAEEAIGGVLLDLERYPQALDHFGNALAASRELNQLVEYHLLDYADALWRVGDYDGAKRILAGLPPASRKLPVIAERFSEIDAAMLLSQQRYAEAKEIARAALANKSNGDPGFYYRAMGQIETASGSPARAREWNQKAVDQAQKDSDQYGLAAATLALANAYLAAGSANQALPLAQGALDFFLASNQRESEYFSLLTLAKASRSAKNTTDSIRFAQQGMDILSGFEHTYSAQQYKTYLSRPDVRDASAQLARLLK